MQLSAIQPFTLLDFPGRAACIAFTPGCNLRCGFCHNPEFVLPEEIVKIKDSFISEEVFFNFLDKRKTLLDGVVISGGEPTMMRGLLDFMREIKKRGFLVKLDTNGTRPEVISQAIREGIVDYIAMDVKVPSEKYSELIGGGVDGRKIKESIYLIMSSGVEHEFRSTIIKEIHTKEMLEQMVNEISGASVWYLQQFRPKKTLDPLYQNKKPYSKKEMEQFVGMFEDKVQKIAIRA